MSFWEVKEQAERREKKRLSKEDIAHLYFSIFRRLVKLSTFVSSETVDARKKGRKARNYEAR
jgi:hypothetical protein